MWDTPVLKETHGMELWDLYKANKTREEVFQHAMRNLNSISSYALVHDFEWQQFTRIIDYGGGTGAFLEELLKEYSDLEGVLFDKPTVITTAQEIWMHFEALSRKVTFVGGDFFEEETLPRFQAGDVIVLRAILHDWSDSDALKILKTLRRAITLSNIPDNSVKIVLLELMLTEKDPINGKFLADLMMKVSYTHAKERYRSQWEKLLRDSDFALVSVSMTRSIFSVLQAIPM